MIVDFKIKGDIKKGVILIHNGNDFEAVQVSDILKPLYKYISDLQNREEIYLNKIKQQDQRIDKYEKMMGDFIKIFGGNK